MLGGIGAEQHAAMGWRGVENAIQQYLRLTFEEDKGIVARSGGTQDGQPLPVSVVVAATQ
jgi:hypothetical protein